MPSWWSVEQRRSSILGLRHRKLDPRFDFGALVSLLEEIDPLHEALEVVASMPLCSAWSAGTRSLENTTNKGLRDFIMNVRYTLGE
jgi:hypothetical protein